MLAIILFLSLLLITFSHINHRFLLRYVVSLVS